MKKKTLCIILTIGLLTVGVLLVHLVIDARRPTKITVNVEAVGQINYNNYITDNRLDYKSNQFAWQSGSLLGSKLTLLTNRSEPTVLSGITAPFQLLEDRVVFIKNGNLNQRIYSNTQDIRIAVNVSSFIAFKNGVLFLTEDTLFQYDWCTASSNAIGENVYSFFIHHNYIYVVDYDGNLMRLETDGTWVKLYTFQVPSYPFYVMPQGGTVIYRAYNELRFVDLATGKTEAVRLANDNYANNRVNFICDDSRLFVSFQATTTNGSIVTDVQNTSNGVWFIDPKTKEMEKLCDDVFEQLYLFDANQLFGVKNDHLFQINIETGLVTKVSD